MDVQRKKGILEVCVLAVLKKGPSYGYLIIRELERCVDISESTLYPILKRLEQNGSLETYRLEYNGRMRKYYRLTEDGQRKIDVFLDEWDELRTMYEFVATQNAKTPEENTRISEESLRTPEPDASSAQAKAAGAAEDGETSVGEATEDSGTSTDEATESVEISTDEITGDSGTSTDEATESIEISTDEIAEDGETSADEDRKSGEEEQR